MRLPKQTVLQVQTGSTPFTWPRLVSAPSAAGSPLCAGMLGVRRWVVYILPAQTSPTSVSSSPLRCPWPDTSFLPLQGLHLVLLKGRAVLRKPDPDLTTVPLKTLLGLPSAYKGKSGLLVWPFSLPGSSSLPQDLCPCIPCLKCLFQGSSCGWLSAFTHRGLPKDLLPWWSSGYFTLPMQGPMFNPGQRARPHMPQLGLHTTASRSCILKLSSWPPTTKETTCF